MLESLLPETIEILHRTEDETELKIRLEPRENRCLGRTGLAEFLDQADPYEITINYKPESKSIDYAIAQEALRILRFSKAPPEQRYALISTEETKRIAYKTMEKELEVLHPEISGVEIKGYSIFYDGLLDELLSVPGDFWINKWLYENYPSFREEMGAGLGEIFRAAHWALSKHVEDLVPKTVYRASHGMIAVFAGFIAELLGRGEFVKPYRGTEFEVLGAKLRRHNPTDRGASGDKETTDNWARELGLVGWYGWRKT